MSVKSALTDITTTTTRYFTDDDVRDQRAKRTTRRMRNFF